ncbi:hypothetical protein A9Q96_16835 [Rhodobacterales bacterium 52_120_T64]|nr:hypothetical protein A9Q96_16835 [Rhodobacterales bacterium 52_120_T64]
MNDTQSISFRLQIKILHRQFRAIFPAASSNVEVALMWMRAYNTRVFLSGFKYLFLLNDLVAGVGFEPTTFRL